MQVSIEDVVDPQRHLSDSLGISVPSVITMSFSTLDYIETVPPTPGCLIWAKVGVDGCKLLISDCGSGPACTVPGLGQHQRGRLVGFGLQSVPVPG